jgi:Protein of unknown function (DUF4232)
MRFSRLLLLACVAVIGTLVVVACGNSSNTSDESGGGGGGGVTTIIQTQTVTRTVTATPRTTTTTAPLTPTTATKTTTTAFAHGTACTASDLTPTYLGSNGAAGTIVLGFAVKNTGSTTCHTYGWPGVQFQSSSGAALPTNAARTTSDLLGATPATALTLKPGEQASFRLVTHDSAAGGRNCRNAHQLQIYAPDDTATMKVSITGGVPACGSATLSPLLPGGSAFAGQ